MRLHEKVVLITGGASGIGRATAQAAVNEGASVVLGDLPDSAGAETAAEIERQYPGRCYFQPTDTRLTRETDALVSAAIERFGRIDVVFASAGIGSYGSVDTIDDEAFSKVLDVNLMGVFRLARSALRPMYRQGHGSIVTCASVLGSFGQTQASAYAASKAAVINLTRTLALEAAPHGVRVNAVSPGYTDTPILARLPEKVRQRLIALHPMGRFARPQEVANAVIFLASDEASFVTGTNLLVDGGFSAGKS